MSHLSSSNPSPTEPESPHGALLQVLHYLPLRELLAFQRVCPIFCDIISNDPLLWREITVEPPLSSKLTDEALLSITSRAEGKLRSLTLFDCIKISDDGLLAVIEQNPGITKLFVPGCKYLTADGMGEVVKRLYERKGNVNQLQLRLHGLCNIKNYHLDVLNSFLDKDGSRSKSLLPSFYVSNHQIGGDDGRPIDADKCPMCQNVRLVFDCTRDKCRRMEQRCTECRGCSFCIARCGDCGGCIAPKHLWWLLCTESACNHLLCTECWQLSKCNTCNRPFCKGHNSIVGSTTGFICQECADGDFLSNVPQTGY